MKSIFRMFGKTKRGSGRDDFGEEPGGDDTQASSTAAEDDELDADETARSHIDGVASIKREPTLGDFALLQVLGKGSFGKVVLVKRQVSGKIYAMKILRKAQLLRAKQIERTKTERRVLQAINHPFIMRLHYAFQTEDKLYLVLDYCPGGELFFHLSRFRRFPEHVARFYAAELVLAIEFLHSRSIIYRDMKPENVLLDSEGHLKLGDFGLAKDGVSEPAEGAKSICGTPEYMAPEVLNKLGHGQSVDWWGLGMILYELLTGLPPWYTKDRQKLFQRIRYAPLRLPSTLTPEACDVLTRLLDRDPLARLGARRGPDGAAEVQEHPFFREIDFEKLEQRDESQLPPIRPLKADAADEVNENFDPQFTRMAVETDPALIAAEREAQTEPYHEFDNFSFTCASSILIDQDGDDLAAGVDVDRGASLGTAAAAPAASPAEPPPEGGAGEGIKGADVSTEEISVGLG